MLNILNVTHASLLHVTTKNINRDIFSLSFIGFALAIHVLRAQHTLLHLSLEAYLEL